MSADGWFPIETAPKDGKSFLVYLADEGFVTFARWAKKSGNWFFPCEGMYQPDFEAIHVMTHWRPLPNPPQSDKGEGR